MKKGFMFTYVEENIHEAIVYAENEEEARDKLENSDTDSDTIIDSEIDYRHTKLIDTWEE